MSNKKEENKFRINQEIKSPQVKLVGDNVEMGVYSLRDAIKLSDDLELDLVEIAPAQTPPICKIMNYQKFLYDKKKNEKKADTMETKELRFRPNTDEHDLNFKINNAKKFLSKGDRVKVLVAFKGREMAYKSQGAEILQKIVVALEEYGALESELKMESNKMFLFFKPRKK